MMAKQGTTTAPSTRGSFGNRFLNADGDTLLAQFFAIAGLFAALAGARAWLPLTLGGISLAVVIIFASMTLSKPDYAILPTGTFVLPRTLIIILIAVQGFELGGGSIWPWLAAGVLAAVIVGENSVRQVANGAIPYAEQLPGISVRSYGIINARIIFPINTAALLLFAWLTTVGVLGAWLIVIPLVVAVPTVVSLVDGIIRVRSRRVAERKVNDSLAAYEPVFAVHWNAPQGTIYQLAMWLPYLDRLGKKYIVIVRNRATFNDVVALTSSPVLLRPVLEDMDNMVVPSLKVAFYVNTATNNAHFVRYTQIKHIQLNHGDSDKAPSYNPVFRMFDKNFVAGQAAIDRFATHGVHLPRETFSIVGRPQVESIKVSHVPISSRENTTVLYAPTWAGFYADSNYSSIPVGNAMVEALLARGCTVIFRPHPYTTNTKDLAVEVRRITETLQRDRAATGRAHVWGKEAETTMSIVDCFNAADALLADISSVVPDFLYSEKPFAIVAMTDANGSFVEEFPVAKASYLVDSKLSNLDQVLDDLLHDDSLAKSRHAMKTYYLGDFPAAEYAQAFLDEARSFL